MVIIADGNRIAKEILAGLKSEIQLLQKEGIVPSLAVINVGENSASKSFVQKKQEAAGEIGLRVKIENYPASISQEILLQEIAKFNVDPQIHAIVMQLPLPGNFDRQTILDAVNPEKDVDCLTTKNQEKLARGEKNIFLPPAATAILKILSFYQIDWKKAKILIIGTGLLVGKPLVALLRQQRLSFEIANRLTPNLAALTKQAEIIISATGRPGLLTGEMIKEGAVVIDAGTAAAEEGGLQGDVDFSTVSSKVSFLTPVPGGVGPVTVAMLLQNVVAAALAERSKKLDSFSVR